ncbi:MAG: hypothetical protein A2V66_11875 [Ignavibacteria bacterium RBG_13_36_8]|nr:MAG: hypothetical protein A2V66_11875 [Ignavibacteria bacterium RBG_13_36_8]
MPRIKWVPNKKDFKTAYNIYVRDGKTQDDIYDALGISEITYRKWKYRFKQEFKKFDFVNHEMSRKRKEELKEKKHQQKKELLTPRLLTLSLRKRIIEMLENDLSIEQIADICRISVFSIYHWRKHIPGFRQEIEYAKSFANIKVKKALKKRAIGMQIIDKVETKIYNKNGRLITRIEKFRNRELPPSVGAQTFYLINREGWKKDSDTDISNNKGAILDIIDKMSELPGDSDYLKDLEKEVD